MGGSYSSQNEADRIAMNVCSRNFPNCVIIKQGSSWVNYTEQTNSVKMASMIVKSKNTCKSLGFTEGTEKFTDCALKLYTQEIELAAKNNQKVQYMSGGVMTIYDPVRDNQRMINQGMKMLSGRCTVGIDC